MVLGQTAEGTGGLSLFDPEGGRRATIKAAADGAAVIGIYGKDGAAKFEQK